MIHRNLTFLFSLLTVLSCGHAGIFLCDFKMTTIGAIEEVYGCNATWVQREGESPNLEGVVGQNLPGKTYTDVGHLNVETRPDFIPKGIELYFPNLLSLRWFKTNLSVISKEDLRPFPQLKVLYLPVNQIVVLGGDLFSFTPDLLWISFIQNQIEQVGHDLLTDLKDLERVFFNENPCINDYAIDREGIKRLNAILPVNCTYVETTTTTTTTTQSTTTPTTTELTTNPPDECSEPCLIRIELSEREISKLHDEISKLHVSNDILNAENGALNNQIASLNDEVLELQSFTEALAARVEETEKKLREISSSPSS